ncbi:MAG: YajQ family cyclic di-GMP-binding protein [Verrucomicrobiota bacterium]
MPSFDIASDVDMAEVKNAVLMTRREVQNRYDFKGVTWDIEESPTQLVLSAADEVKLRALDQALMSKLAKRELPLKNFEHKKMDLSSMGRARQEIAIRQGFETDIAKKVVKQIKGLGIKVQAQLQDKQVRVTGKSRNDLQAVIAAVKEFDIPVGVTFSNFRD